MVKKFVKNKKGFTLIELVVVVAILGVLSMLVVPNVINRIDEARNAVLNANIKVINNAIRMYYFEKGDYPPVSGNSENEKVASLIDKLAEAKYLDPHEADNAKESLKDKVKVNTNSEGKATDIQKMQSTSQNSNP